MDPTHIRDWITERLFNAGSHIYGPYVLSAFAIMFGVLWLGKRLAPGQALAVLFDRRVWWRRSTLTDLLVTLLHFLFVMVPAGALKVAIIGWMSVALIEPLGLRGALSVPAPIWLQMGVATVLVMVCLDFGAYFAHRCMHAFPWLWNFHMVHHSAETLTLLTTNRIHPVEYTIISAFYGVAGGVAVFLLHLVFPEVRDVYEMWGIGVGIVLFMFTADLQHSHVPVRYPAFLRSFLYSPHLHHVHHSTDPADFDTNFGVMLSWPDMLFRTYRERPVELGEVTYGLGAEDPFHESLPRLYLKPFLMPFLRNRSGAG